MSEWLFDTSSVKPSQTPDAEEAKTGIPVLEAQEKPRSQTAARDAYALDAKPTPTPAPAVPEPDDVPARAYVPETLANHPDIAKALAEGYSIGDVKNGRNAARTPCTPRLAQAQHRLGITARAPMRS